MAENRHPHHHLHEKISRRRRLIRSFEKKALGHRTLPEKIADHVTVNTGSIVFLLLNMYFFLAWIVINLDFIPGLHPFDPYPYGMLTMVVSLEAIVLSIFVLISQNRAAKIDALRDELHLQVNLIAEEEITKVLEVLNDVRTKVGIKKEDPELTRMLQRIDTSYIEQSLQKQMENNNIDYMNINPLTAIHGSTDLTKEITKEVVEKAEKIVLKEKPQKDSKK
jgi:uncharacterized membrane protein